MTSGRDVSDSPDAGARAHGPPLFQAGFRAAPAHFEVSEELGFQPSGEGEHEFLYVEKTGANTDWVARGLARHAGVRQVDVGYAGRKDRHAVTRQWFSVRTAASDVDWTGLTLSGVRVLDVSRHNRKLRRGAHRGNRFRLLLVDVSAFRFADLVTRLECISERGVPNYFGPQRFGRNNLELARRVLGGERLRRNERSLGLSAARARLFNAILDARVAGGSWDRLLPGDVANLDGSNSVFPVDHVDDELAARTRQHDIHPTASLWGRPGTCRAGGEAGALEAAVTADYADMAAQLEHAGVDAAHRPCRVVPASLLAVATANQVSLSFSLPSGAYATAVIRELASVNDYSKREAR